MARYKYSRWLKLKIAKEAMLPENQGLEHVIAEKYHVMPWTVTRWRDHLQDVGEENVVLCQDLVQVKMRNFSPF